jgi:D-alanine-D-alanine ligase-like ATP-grasp enzyme
MARQTVLLVYGGESANREVSIRSARSVYAAMDGEKYETLLGYIDPHGKWWLLERWTDQLDEHGGSQLVAALGSHSFLVLPGNTLVRPDVVMPVCGGSEEYEAVVGLCHLLHVATTTPTVVTGILTRYPHGVLKRLNQRGLDMADDSSAGVYFVVAISGSGSGIISSVAASIVENTGNDDMLRSLGDEAVSWRIRDTAVLFYEAMRCRNYALVTLSQDDDQLSLVSIDVAPELSTSGTFLKLWRMSGVRYPEVVDNLIATARR